MPVDQVVDVTPVRNGVVTAARAVNVSLRVAGACVRRGAHHGVRGRHADGALVDVAPVGGVQVAVVRIVRMTIMRDLRVTAARSVHVIAVSFVDRMLTHDVVLGV